MQGSEQVIQSQRVKRRFVAHPCAGDGRHRHRHPVAGRRREEGERHHTGGLGEAGWTTGDASFSFIEWCRCCSAVGRAVEVGCCGERECVVFGFGEGRSSILGVWAMGACDWRAVVRGVASA